MDLRTISESGVEGSHSSDVAVESCEKRVNEVDVSAVHNMELELHCEAVSDTSDIVTQQEQELHTDDNIG